MNLGDGIGHRAPEYGKVSTGTYEVPPGTYTVTIKHKGTDPNWKGDDQNPSPDYDYTARLEKVSGDAKVTINDPDGKFSQELII